MAKKLNNLLPLSSAPAFHFPIDLGPGGVPKGAGCDPCGAQHRPLPPPMPGPSGALTLLLVDVGGQVGRVGAVAEVVVAVRDERGEWVDSVGRLHDGNFVGLQERRRRGLSGRPGPGCEEGARDHRALPAARAFGVLLLQRGWQLQQASQGKAENTPLCLNKHILQEKSTITQ